MKRVWFLINDCLPSLFFNHHHSTHHQPIDKYVQNLNYCGTHTPCLYGGTCHHLGGEKFNCSCPEGLSGRRCEIIVDPCATSPCKNGATCTVKDPSALNVTKKAEIIPRNYRGRSSAMGAPVSVRPVLATIGTSAENETNYVCTCASGFTGQQCEQGKYHKKCLRM
jgi:jagged-like protein